MRAKIREGVPENAVDYPGAVSCEVPLSGLAPRAVLHRHRQACLERREGIRFRWRLTVLMLHVHSVHVVTIHKSK